MTRHQRYSGCVSVTPKAHRRLKAQAAREGTTIGLRRCEEWRALHGKSAVSTVVDEQANEIDTQLLERLRATVQP